MDRNSAVLSFRTVRKERNREVTRSLDFFNLDVIISELNRIFAMARTTALDTVEIEKNLFRKAVNYIRNQGQTLRNFGLDGNVEISNNLVEQRMKPIKLSMKNCLNIGSENAAINAAFMHSIVESCRLNSKNPYQYLLALFRSVGKALDGPAKRKLMPDIWVPEC